MFGGDAAQPARGRGLHGAAGAVEPDHPRRGLGGEADLGVEQRGEAAVAVADGVGERADRHGAAAAVQQPPGVDDGGRRARAVLAGDERAQLVVEDGEALPPGARLAEAVADPLDEAAEHGVGVAVGPGELARGQAEQRPRRVRVDLELDPDWRPSWVISAGVVCRPPASAS